MRQAKSQIYLDVLILSEFANRYIKIEARSQGILDSKIKEWRRSDSFKSVLKGFKHAYEQLTCGCILVDHPFLSTNPQELFQAWSTGFIDLNDKLIAQTAVEYNLWILTNDADYYNLPASLLTVNPHLIRRG